MTPAQAAQKITALRKEVGRHDELYHRKAAPEISDQDYDQLKRRRGSKRAIVAVARRLLGVLASMLKAGEKYRWSLSELKEREAKAEQRKHKRRVAKTTKEIKEAATV